MVTTGRARTVDPGRVISTDDLKVVRVATDPDVNTIAASARSSIAGQRAAARLLPGSLLSPEAVTKGDVIGPGLSVISAIVKPGQHPLGLPLDVLPLDEARSDVCRENLCVQRAQDESSVRPPQYIAPGSGEADLARYRSDPRVRERGREAPTDDRQCVAGLGHAASMQSPRTTRRG